MLRWSTRKGGGEFFSLWQHGFERPLKLPSICARRSTVQKVERIPVRDDARRQGKENPNDFGWAFITILIEYHRTVVNA